MSTRTEKVESLVRQTVAQGLLAALDADGARVTVTGVDITPDLRQATVWVAVLAEGEERERIYQAVLGSRLELQGAVAHSLTTKFTPKLQFKLDAGGEYASYISGLIDKL